MALYSGGRCAAGTNTYIGANRNTSLGERVTSKCMDFILPKFFLLLLTVANPGQTATKGGVVIWPRELKGLSQATEEREPWGNKVQLEKELPGN